MKDKIKDEIKKNIKSRISELEGKAGLGATTQANWDKQMLARLKEIYPTEEVNEAYQEALEELPAEGIKVVERRGGIGHIFSK